jgi:hypothetical protein
MSEVTNGSYLIKDLTEGDELISKREDFLSLNGEEIRQAINLILNRPDLSERQKHQILSNTWKIHYRQKPPTIDEFLSPEWIGPTADSLFPHVKDILTNFWMPESTYRHLLLGSAIGTGKALPDSSPVVIEEVPIIEIELEDGNKLTFDEEEIIWFYDTKLKCIEAKNINLVEIKDFPVLLNYYNMKIYNVKRFPEFKEAYDISSYDKLIDFFKEFNEDYFQERDIIINKHHITPRCEGGNNYKSNLVLLPFYFHIKAHYLRAKEHELCGNKLFALRNYKAVIYTLGIPQLPKEEKEVFKKIEFVAESLEKRNFFESEQFFIKKEGKKSKKIFKEDWSSYKILGWEKGRNFKNSSGKKWINKDEESYCVDEDLIDDYLNKGYSLGMFLTKKMLDANLKRASYATLNTVWMNKDGKRKCVKQEEVEEYLKNGWIKGSLSTTNLGQTWTWKEKNIGRNIYTNGHKEVWAYECPNGFYKGKKTKGKLWFNNGKEMILSDKCPEGFKRGRLCCRKNWYNNGKEELFMEECPEGFKPGKLSTGKHWYTNGIDSIQSTSCPEGWWEGRTYANKKNK